MIRILLLAAFLLQTTAPTTAPTTQPIAFGKGEVIVIPPTGGWEESRRPDDGGSAIFRWEDRATMVINVTPLTVSLTKEVKQKMANLISQKSVADANQKGYRLLQPPTVEDDGRFVLKMRQRFLNGEQETNQIQMYREIGNWLVHVAVTVRGDTEDQVQSLQRDAEVMLAEARSSRTQVKKAPSTRPANPIVLQQARLRVTPPGGWKVEPHDATEGIVAWFRDPESSVNLIAVSVRPLPAEAKRDPKLRDAIINEMVEAERQQFVLDGAAIDGEAETIKDTRFLKKTRTKYHAKDVRFHVVARQMRIGDVVASFTCVCLESESEAVNQLADQAALSARPVSVRP